jgi:hypothetical protein
MNKGFFASLFVITTAAAFGYWLWSDTALTPPSTLKLEEIIRAQPQTAPTAAETTERYSAGQFVELIDLSTVFEPTGEELALQFLLGSIDSTEYLSMPRVAPMESLPEPRQTAYEALPWPRLAAADTFPDAGEEASSPPSRFDLLRRQMSEIVGRKLVEMLSEMQPLKGSASAPVDNGDEM